MRILSVLHPGGGHSGLLRERAVSAGHELLEWRAADGTERPADADAIAVFGGGMNRADADRLPWLEDEIELLHAALEDGTPVLGVCLGSQLLAAAAGAEVRRAERPEIGWFEVERTEAGAADPLLGALPERFTAYQWHSWAFALPDGAVELARSPVCPHAFRVGASVGLQFHPEVTLAIVEDWLDGAPAAVPDPEPIRSETASTADAARERAFALMDAIAARWPR
jgi:GMP synthase (glutamine-hydrolysing)